MKKQTLTILCFLLCSLFSLAESPDKLSYQSIVRFANGKVVKSEITIKLSILEGSSATTADNIYNETITTTPNSHGLVIIKYGGGFGWDAINWASNSHYIKTETDIDNDGFFDMENISQLLTVPYAIHSKTADQLTGELSITEDQITNLGNYIIEGEETDPEFNAWDKDYEDLINKPDLSEFLTEESDPEFTAWDKDYEDLINKPDLSNFLTAESDPEFTAWDKDYEDLTNKPDLENYLTEESDPQFTAWDKNYNSLTNKPDLSIYATKDMNNERITNLADPVNNQDAATKAYVDALKAVLFNIATPAQLVKGGVPLHEVLSDEITIGKLLEQGVTAEELIDAGATIEELFAVGVAYVKNGVTDIDGNQYKVAKVGNQIWMGENLKTTKYADGTVIPYMSNTTDWSALEGNNTDDGYAFYTFRSEFKADFGALYNYAAAINGDASGNNVQGACPDGWHLPSNAEWIVLKNYLSNSGHTNLEGKAMKAEREWRNASYGTDDFNMAILPAGLLHGSGVSELLYESTFFWTSTLNNLLNSEAYILDNADLLIGRATDKSIGASVRCVKND